MPATRITWHDVLTMPEDGNRYEAIGGELYVTPPPKNLHQWILTNLFIALVDLLMKPGHGRVFTAPIGVEFPGRGRPAGHPVRLRRAPLHRHRGLDPRRAGPRDRDPESEHRAARPYGQARAVPPPRRRRVLDRGSGRAAGRGLALRGGGDRAPAMHAACQRAARREDRGRDRAGERVRLASVGASTGTGSTPPLPALRAPATAETAPPRAISPIHLPSVY